MNKKIFSFWMFSQLTVVSSEERNLRGHKRSRRNREQEEFHRHLAESAAERFAYWTPEKVKRATPLDLKLDALSGDAYLSGLGGNLQLYADAFAKRSTPSKKRMFNRKEGDEQSNVLYWDSVVSLDDLMRDDSFGSAGRFVDSHSRRELRIISKDQMDSSSMISLLDNGADTDELALYKNNKSDPVPKGNKQGVKGKKQKQKKQPKVRQLKPSNGDIVKEEQTFRAKVLPAKDDEVSAVYIQLTDFEGTKSNYISLSPVSPGPNENMYEVSLGGFKEKYAGTEWSYQIIVQERSGVQYSFGDVQFTVDGARSIESSSPTSTPLVSSSIDEGTVLDAQWPYGGGIQSSTGRILFDFGRESHVCSGTVVNDGGIYNKRSIILTAAHCAFDDLTKQFASNAIFIPDQASTTGGGTDFDCTNDKYGCWYLSFAVVENRWADNQFPINAPFDYAFFVVHDYVSQHISGFTEGLTGTLDQDIIPATIDFSADPQGKYFSSFGYSEDYDPLFRYCAGDVKSIREVPNYTNLWLPSCNLQGGASGGPWVADIDQSGLGTIMSLNSWGFIDGAGMAGPSLQTSSGSKAQCLFEIAKTSQDPGSTRGYSVNCN